MCLERGEDGVDLLLVCVFRDHFLGVLIGGVDEIRMRTTGPVLLGGEERCVVLL
jgi:hypothetical protein